MPDTPFAAVHVDDIPAIAPSQAGESAWKPVRRQLDIEAFGVNAYVAAAPGDLVIEEHDEAGDGAPHQELYFVATGHVTFGLDGEAIEAPAGTFVFVADPAVRRSASAHAAGDTVLAFGAPAGAAYAVPEWESRELGAA